ncbi:right-handed parallel beta-helix repeat-containing protein [Gramella sp. GC03-9]|uniref:Right-handed parallel beta-helix repeat-containing protein n=1 Tax=Christiangramia oceanisediminis TaxID=2920386 RepID=A0A9X2L0B1_9FLAO|nr:right-handed parallel beta-helix repeat-containing protein [Gramella oceanisediminis]MCP9201507.1 right-handed parallel beta-helix repeat-containing protein [Gramella oceanisediminis]
MTLTYNLKPLFEARISRSLFYLFIAMMISSCSTDADDILEETPIESGTEKDLSQDLNGKTSLYKGIFATTTSGYRGTFKLEIPGGVQDLSNIDPESKGTLKLSNGETFIAEYSNTRQSSATNKSADVKVDFDSKDFSFTFTVDEYDNPVLSDVVLKERDGAIVAAEETEGTSITPVTGTYKCTNCQDQDSPLEGIDLDNSDRTFNMLLTNADGTTSIDIQALVGILVDTKLVLEQSCTNSEDYSFCVLKSGENGQNEDLDWSAVHRFTNTTTNETCSNLAGNFAFQYQGFGTIEGEFNSDSTCPNKTYFVSSTGNDSNTGLAPEDAWRSIEKVNSIDIQPGDVIQFEGGQEFEGNLYLDANDANNSASPVLISSYGDGRAIINAGNSFGIYAYNTSGVKIDQLIVKGSGMNTNENSGIYFYTDLPGDVKLDFVEITNSEVYGFRDFGIVIGAYNHNSGFTNVLIENNKVHGILDAGISSYGHFKASKTGYAHSNITVRNCEVFNVPGYSKNTHSGNGIVLSDVQNSVIEHSTVYDCGSGNTNCGGPVGIWYWDADNVTIQYSEVYNMSSGTGCDGAGFDLDGGVTNGVMQYNYSHDNDGAGFMVGQFGGARPMSNIIVRYNVSQNDAATNGGSVYLFNGSSEDSMKDILVHNNTLFISKRANIKYTSWKPFMHNINFQNNILYATNGASLISIPSGYDGNFAGNLYYAPDGFKINYKGTSYSSLEEFRNTGNEIYDAAPVGYQGDPLLSNPGKAGIVGFGNPLSDLTEYTLQASSPAINSGIPISNPGSRDFYGTNFSGTPNDIGAHEADTSNKNYNNLASK